MFFLGGLQNLSQNIYIHIFKLFESSKLVFSFLLNILELTQGESWKLFNFYALFAYPVFFLFVFFLK